MDETNPLDLPIETQFATAPMQQDCVAEEHVLDAEPVPDVARRVEINLTGEGIEARLVGLLVIAGVKAEALAGQAGHLAAFEGQSLARILFSLQACLADLRATKAVLTAA